MVEVVTLYRSKVARAGGLLHRYPDCCGRRSESLEGCVRESECSGDYAVHSETFFVLGRMCGYCQTRHKAGKDRR